MSQNRLFHFALPLVVLPVAVWAAWVAAADTKVVPAGTSTPAAAKAKDDGSKYIRVEDDAKGNPLALETAIVHFVPKGTDRPGLQVDLVSAIHVGDAGYYEALNKRFTNYDAVIYELVAPEGTVVPRGGGERSGNPLSVLQHKFKEVLELEHQLVGVDYTKKNFVHGDLSPDEFFKSMNDKGESVWTILLRLVAADASQRAEKVKKQDESYWTTIGRIVVAGVTQSPPIDPQEMRLLMALVDKDRALKLKRALASQVADMDKVMLAFNGSEGSTIITERNKAALKVLAQQIKAGNKKIAIFYGGGHMTDMESRLTADFNLQRDKEEWLEAWNLRDKK